MILETENVTTRTVHVRVLPTALLTPRNLKALLADMSLQPGVHVAADLYRWYVGMCDEVDAQPISKKAFGLSLANQGCTPTVKRISGKLHRCWLIPRSRFRDALVAHEPRPEFSAESRHATLAHPSGT